MKYLLYTILFSTLFSLSANAAMQTSAKQAVVIDMGTGMTLLSKDADKKMPTSSMSKVMTAYMVFEALRQGTVQINSRLPVSEKSWSKGGSKMFLEVGDDVTVEDLLKGLIVQSGNDAAIALAEGLAGDEAVFAKAMTERAHALGMKDSNFTNASGWPDPDHYSTAHDLAILAQRLIVDFPHEYAIYGIKEFTYAGITQANRNPLLYRNMGVDGIKTGHTEAGGYGLIASGERDGRRVVAVLNGMQSKKERADESARIMGWALNGFVNLDVLKQGDVVELASTANAKDDNIGLAVNRDVTVTIPKTKQGNLKIEVEYTSPVIAPVKQGDVLGTLHVTVPDQGVFKVPLVASLDLEESGFFGRIGQALYSLIFGG